MVHDGNAASYHFACTGFLGWLNKQSTSGLLDRLSHWLAGCLRACVAACLVGWLGGRLLACLFARIQHVNVQ